MVKVFFAGIEAGLVRIIKEENQNTYMRVFDIIKNGLASFYYNESFDSQFFWEMCRPKLESLMIDSGAYSFFSTSGLVGGQHKAKSWNKNRPRDVVEYTHTYCKWLLEHKDKISVYIELDIDKVFGWEKQQEIRDIFETYGLNPLLVYHPQNRWHFEDYCERYDYVGVGSTIGASMNLALHYLDIAKKHDTKCHLFGFTNQRNLINLNHHPSLYSVDSTSWNEGLKFAKLAFFNGARLVPYPRGHKFNEVEPYRRFLYSAQQWQLFADHLEATGACK